MCESPYHGTPCPRVNPDPAEPELGVQLWWHAFGRVVPEGEFLAGSYHLVVAGPGTIAPHLVEEMGKLGEVPYLASFDHEPTRAERAGLTPEEYRDEVTDDELADDESGGEA